MTAGRKPAPAPQDAAPLMNDAAVAQAGQALNELSAISREISQRFGEGRPYERERLVGEAKFFMGQSAEAMLQAGTRLIQLKENEPHGEFEIILEERLGLAPRSAQRLMQAAVRYLAPAIAQAVHAPKLLGLGRAKLFDLLAEGEDEIAALAQGGTLAGHTLDALDGMTRREMLASLKESKERLTAKDKVLAGKDAKLNTLQEQLELRDLALAGKDEQAQLDTVRDAALSAEMALRRLVHDVQLVLQVPVNANTQVAARGELEFVAQVFATLIHESDAPVDFVDMVTPHWLKGVTKVPDKAADKGAGPG